MLEEQDVHVGGVVRPCWRSRTSMLGEQDAHVGGAGRPCWGSRRSMLWEMDVHVGGAGRSCWGTWTFMVSPMNFHGADHGFSWCRPWIFMVPTMDFHGADHGFSCFGTSTNSCMNMSTHAAGSKSAFWLEFGFVTASPSSSRDCQPQRVPRFLVATGNGRSETSFEQKKPNPSRTISSPASNNYRWLPLLLICAVADVVREFCLFFSEGNMKLGYKSRKESVSLSGCCAQAKNGNH
jgi:hypothetical protein